jgi:predicted glycoside hydrolase/deacetylase ChbG (UPF0249 family)
VAELPIEADATVHPALPRHLIVNADDFGASRGINRGIVEAHERGIVTSASLMVDRPCASEAAELAAAHPRISVGLHFEEPGGGFDAGDQAAAVAELGRQLERFGELVGREPTHVDSHHHVHRQPGALEAFAELATALGVPLRDVSPVAYIGGFYAQWEWEVTELRYVSVEFLQQILRTEVTAEWTELGCHPGYLSKDFQSVYLTEREYELRTLSDPQVRDTIAELGIELCSYGDYAAQAAVGVTGPAGREPPGR